MNHLNYCRQLMMQITQIASIPSTPKEIKTRLHQLMDLSSISQKFILPEGGLVIYDTELRGLGCDITLRLPHQFVALEFQPKKRSENESGGASKAILFAREHPETGSICITPAFFQTANGKWDFYDDALIPVTGYINTTATANKKSQTINFAYPENCDQELYSQIVSVVLAFLNALSCSNVHIAKSEQKRTCRKVKAALPFDTYHVLTIDVPSRSGERGNPTGPHRAPREHLRRGHIRRLADSRRIWVNATVVSAGRGAGVVKKDYALRVAA